MPSSRGTCTIICFKGGQNNTLPQRGILLLPGSIWPTQPSPAPTAKKGKDEVQIWWAGHFWVACLLLSASLVIPICIYVAITHRSHHHENTSGETITMQRGVLPNAFPVSLWIFSLKTNASIKSPGKLKHLQPNPYPTPQWVHMKLPYTVSKVHQHQSFLLRFAEVLQGLRQVFHIT